MKNLNRIELAKLGFTGNPGRDLLGDLASLAPIDDLRELAARYLCLPSDDEPNKGGCAVIYRLTNQVA